MTRINRRQSVNHQPNIDRGAMAEIDVDAAARFMARHGRLLDRRRFDLLCGTGDAGSMLGALEGYHNPDGGYGWGIEPDARSP